MASRIPTSDVTLPSIRTLFPPSTFSSQSPSPSSDDEMLFTPFTQKKQLSHNQPYPTPRMPLPFYAPGNINHSRRASTASNYSVPSLTHSPSPTPSPPPPPSRQNFRLVPCSLQSADVVVVAGCPSSSPGASPSAKCSGTNATMLVGPAISRATKDDRKMHPYRVVRDRRA